MSDKMRKALERDGEKLRALTGKDHGPRLVCEACDGERVLWLMSEFPVPCPDCNPNSPQFKRKGRPLTPRKPKVVKALEAARKLLAYEYDAILDCSCPHENGKPDVSRIDGSFRALAARYRRVIKLIDTDLLSIPGHGTKRRRK